MIRAGCNMELTPHCSALGLISIHVVFEDACDVADLPRVSEFLDSAKTPRMLVPCFILLNDSMSCSLNVTR